MKENTQNALILGAAALVGAVLAGPASYSSGRADGQKEYKATMHQDCALVGFHRIGTDVYICTDVKKAAQETLDQKDSTISSQTVE